MGVFLVLVALVIFFSIFYLLNFSKNKKIFFFFLLSFFPQVYLFIISKEIKFHSLTTLN